MKNKAFTLVELLAVIVILSIILIIAVPQITSIIGETRQKAFEASEKLFVNAAEKYASLEEFELPTAENPIKNISYDTLKNAKYITNIKNPKTSEECPNASVQIKYIGPNEYTYSPKIICGEYESSGPTLPPIIALVGDNPYEVEINTTYSDPGATAYDSADGDVSDDIVVDASNLDVSAEGSYTVTYNVDDSDENSAEEVIRTVNVIIVDDEIPVISLIGNNPQSIQPDAVYEELGALATDNYDNDTLLTATIVIDSSEVDTSTRGEYIVTYNVTDSKGNVASEVTRTVNVEYPLNYANRMKLTVDSSLIDESLTHFPLTVHLNMANGTDTIFTEVGNNNKKIAFTNSDGAIELYAEIEKWDLANKIATVHVSRDSFVISPTGDTHIYVL